MALDPNINTREFNKFRDAGNPLTRVAVEIEQDSAGLATEQTLSDFKDQAHADSQDEQSDLLNINQSINDFSDQSHQDSVDEQADINEVNTSVQQFQVEAHQDSLDEQAKQDILNTRVGDVTETAPASDTASSGLNGRLQRIAQHITSLIAFFSSNYGASSGGIRTASQIGNATGEANFNSGSTGAQTLRTASNLYDSAGNALTTRSYNSVRPVDVFLPQIGAATATHTRVTPTANVSTQLLAANANRKWVFISNNSGAAFYLNFGGTAIISQGFEVVQNGGTLRIDATLLYTGAINGIVGSNSRTIELIEGV